MKADETLSGRLVRHTADRSNNHPLYYFVPSITADSRYLIFHSDRSGWVELHRLDLANGAVEQLTEGRSYDSGWAIWCEYRLRGIYNHLSSLDPAKGLVAYFAGEWLETVSALTGVRTRRYHLGDRTPVGQSSFSPSGSLFAFIHADRRRFSTSLAERESLEKMRRFDWGRDHQTWRNLNPTTISILDIERSELRNEIVLDYHVHHVLFLDEENLLVNHVRDDNGMWRIGVDGSDERILRPRDGHGAVCHQLVTRNGIRYEASRTEAGRKRTVMGAYDPGSNTWRELSLDESGYVHTGNDPEGELIFLELDGDSHGLYSAEPAADGTRLELSLLRTLPKIPSGQRYQAHPFLSPDRKRLFFTELVDGYSQIHSIDASDLHRGNGKWSIVDRGL